MRIVTLALFVLLAVTLTFSQQKSGITNWMPHKKNTLRESAPSAKDNDKSEGDPLFKACSTVRSALSRRPFAYGSWNSRRSDTYYFVRRRRRMEIHRRRQYMVSGF